MRFPTRFLPLLLLVAPVACGGSHAPVPAPLPSAPAPVASSATSAAAASPAYPATRTVDVSDVMFGTVVRDPYRWLEDGKSQEVQSWAAGEDAFARAYLANLADRAGRADIAKRLETLAYVDSRDVPARRGGRLFYLRRMATAEKPAVVVVEGGVERVLLDANAWPADEHRALKYASASWDGKKLAYAASVNNADAMTLYVLDVDTGKVSDVDVLPGVGFGAVSFSAGSDGIYYPRSPTRDDLNEAEKAAQAELVYHRLGDPPSADRVIREKTGDPQLESDGWATRDGHWIIAQRRHGSSGSTDTWVKDLRAGAGAPWAPLAVDTHGHYDVSEHRDRFYVSTDDGAPHGHLYAVDPGKMDRASWKELVAERADAALEGFSIVGGRLALVYLKDVVSHLEVHELDGTLVREMPVPAIGAVSGLAGDPESDTAYFTFTSFTYPTEIYETSVATGATSLWYRSPSPVDSSRFAVEQRFFASKDGTRVPMFIVHDKSWTKEKGPMPLILHGYGGFDLSQKPGFIPEIVPWLERGGAYALANLRGGAEYGEAWHVAGELHAKQNVFDDFIAAAEALVSWGYTTQDDLVAEGRSNGGLLVGAVTTQRPDLFRVVVCTVPLLDMIRYPQFGGGQFWVEEYGSPQKEDDFRALFAYSPYHHVTPGTRYPSFLMMSSDSDDRVDPMHARKFIAELQAATTGGPALLRVERHAGHAGNDTRRAWVNARADEYAFALSQLTTRSPPPAPPTAAP